MTLCQVVEFDLHLLLDSILVMNRSVANTKGIDFRLHVSPIRLQAPNLIESDSCSSWSLI